MNYELLQGIALWVLRIAGVCALALGLVWYFGQRVSVIGDSMNPKLENGDVVLVNRLTYSVGSPKRGDIIAFYPNGNKNSHAYIKRIIALPGEKVSYEEGEILVNGKPLAEKYQSELEDAGLLEDTITLGDDEYFVLGDDRQNSEDSRTANIGNVKRSEIEGKVWFVTSPLSHFGFVR